MLDMNAKLEVWRNKLLDLSKRNAMLNFRDTRRSNMRIVIPAIYDLWQKVVVDEEPLEFPIRDQELLETGDQFKMTGFSDEYSSPVLKTNKTFQEQQKILLNLRSKSKTFIEEQGINALYLSFGFLSWSEATYSEQFFDAPLVLVPITIVLESINSPFVLNLHDDEIVVNPTLKYKLENDFGIKLPEFDEDGDLELYFKRVEEIVSSNGWLVKRETSISMLSFLKINMYNDLERHRGEISENPIVRAIAGDASSISHDISEFDDFEHDSVDPESVFQIVDADSSQQDAILCAKKGTSFVLQGPPGTGKSQTITNIIAECFADGKKVLFVAEKMAALEVVYRRLSEAGLSDFCLTLHSHKARKKDTLEQLGNVLKLVTKKATIRGEIRQQLNRLTEARDLLNSYSSELFEVIQPFNQSIFDVNGALASLQYVPDVIFAIPNVKTTNPKQFNEYISAISRYATILQQMNDDVESNPWRGSTVELVSNELRHDVNANVPKLLDAVKRIEYLSDEIEKELHFGIDSSYVGLQKAKEILNIASQSPVVPAAWIYDGNIDKLIAEIPVQSKIQQAMLSKRSAIQGISKDLFSLDTNKAFICNEEELQTSKSVHEFLDSVRTAFCADKCYSAWDRINDWSHVAKSFNVARANINEANGLAEVISSVYEKDIFTIDYNAIYIEFKAKCTAALKHLNGQYRTYKKLFSGLRLGLNQKPSDNDILDVLIKLRRLEELTAWMQDNQDTLSALFDGLYMGTETDFESIERHMNAYDLIHDYEKEISSYYDCVKKYEDNSQQLKMRFAERYTGVSTNWEDIFQTLTWAKEYAEMIEQYADNSAHFILSTCEATNKALVHEYINKLSLELKVFEPQYSWFTGLFDLDCGLNSIKMPALFDRMKACLEQFTSLEEWIDFRNIRNRCIDKGLKDFVLCTESEHINGNELVDVFKKRFYRLWIDAVLPRCPAIANFRRKNQEQLIDEFKKLDKTQLDIARARIRAGLIDALPSINHFTDGVDELSTLRRELGKQRKIMPIRKLFREIPNLIMTLKPCLMMSPLSVSLFLESDCFNFDTVIFDEASQVCTENAIGAIFRGKQVIIAGDSHQLPPTNFFRVSLSDNDFDSAEDIEDLDDSGSFESVLDEATFLPERTLLWHYRSRHEHLIAYSNAKIYHN
ncbi:MAG TPA: DUF4011 domain-containing protein, partial [Saccharofermentans sp.]|nr:DUF4011 domain-containing protein [Saccharofermentans sp.]